MSFIWSAMSDQGALYYWATLPTPVLNVENLVFGQFSIDNPTANQVYTLDPNALLLIPIDKAMWELAYQINPTTTHLLKFRVPETATVFERYTNQLEVVEIIPVTDVIALVRHPYAYNFFGKICESNENNKRWLATTSIEQLRQRAFEMFDDMILYVNNPTDEDYRYAVEHCGKAIEHINPEKITFDVVKLQLEADVRIIKKIPRACRTHKMIKYAIEKTKSGYSFTRLSSVMESLDDDEKTQDICDMAVQKWAWTIADIPVRCITAELANLAVSNHSYLLKYVPIGLITPELANLAVIKYSKALEYVPRRLITPEMVNLAVANDPMVLEYVPRGLQSRDLVLNALRLKPEAIQFVRCQTQELANMVAFRSSEAMLHVRNEFYTPAMCLHALQKYGWSFNFVRPRNQTIQVCMAGVMRSRKALRNVVHQTPEICMAAVSNNGNALKFVRQQTPKICKMAVQQCKEAIRYVRDEFKTPELMKLVETQ